MVLRNEDGVALATQFQLFKVSYTLSLEALGFVKIMTSPFNAVSNYEECLRMRKTTTELAHSTPQVKYIDQL